MSKLMSIILVIDGFVQAPPTLIWYMLGATQSATLTVSVAEAACSLLGVTLFVDKLNVMPGGEPGVRMTGALKPLTEVMLMVTLLEPPGVVEINCGEAVMRKSGVEPEVMVRLKTALFEAVVALTAKLPTVIFSDGMVTVVFQVPFSLVSPVARVWVALGPESHFRVIFASAANLQVKNVVWPPAATTGGDAHSSGIPAMPTFTAKPYTFGWMPVAWPTSVQK